MNSTSLPVDVPSKCLVNGYPIEVNAFRCFCVRLSLFFYHVRLDYLCSGLLLTIMIISIFGKIKENYRWFILNQAFWDLVITYDFHCYNRAGFNWASAPQTCFYIFSRRSPGFVETFLMAAFQDGMPNNSYSALLLLSFTRFICLYFMGSYEKLTRKRRIFYLILGFNVIFVATLLVEPLAYILFDRRKKGIVEDCGKMFNENTESLNTCLLNSIKQDFLKDFYWNAYKIFGVVNFLKAPLCILVSIFSSLSIMAKVAKQSSFQRKHNTKDFYGSVRVGLVLLVQCSMNALVLIPEILTNTEKISATFGVVFQYLYQGGEWWDNVWGISSEFNVQTLKQMRVLLEAVIVLALMTGYRECLMGVLRFTGKKVWNPQSWISTERSSKVTVLSNEVNK